MRGRMMLELFVLSTTLVLGGCGTQAEKKAATPVSGAAIETPEETKQPVEHVKLSGIVIKTEEPSVEKAKVDAKETRLGVPGYAHSFYLEQDGTPMIEDEVGFHEQADDENVITEKIAPSYRLEGNQWIGFEGTFCKLLRNADIKSNIGWIAPRKNGDYVFLQGSSIVRIAKDGQIKKNMDISKMVEGDWDNDGSLVNKMIYLGDGKTVIEYKKTPFTTNDYYRQETDDLYVALVDLNTEKIVKNFDAGWRLCGGVSETEIFLERERKIIKVDVVTGEVEKRYSTESLWQQAYIDQSDDEMGLPYHTYPIVWTTHDGKLYAKNTGGIFCMEEEKIVWKQCVANEKGDFTLGASYGNTFRVLSNHKAIIMGCRMDDESASDCCSYEWKY